LYDVNLADCLGSAIGNSFLVTAGCLVSDATGSGDELRTARERTGLTQREAAERIGVDSITLSRWERGVHRPPRAAQDALRALYGGAAVDDDSASRNVPRGTEAGGAGGAEGSPRTRFLVSDLLRVVAELVELEAGARGLPVLPADPGATYIGTGRKVPNPNVDVGARKRGSGGGAV
jgi:DNA-binding transcriptional regulator YiaG